jgi:cob(I)alamin adenosyltransferase
MENSYKKRMQRKKEHIDSRIEEANIDKGIVVLLTGNGKGKSSSAMGMICRALGYEMKVALVRFLKGEQQTGEDLFLDSNPNVVSAHMESGFTWNTQDEELDKKRAGETSISMKSQSLRLLVIGQRVSTLLLREELPVRALLRPQTL